MRAMSDSELNPYAPPEAGPDEPAKGKKKKKKKGRASGAIAEALARLNEHVAEPAKVEIDTKEAGGRLRGATMGFIAFAVMAALGTAALGGARNFDDPVFFIAGIFAFVFVVLAVTLVIVDLTIVPRATVAPPDAMLKSYLKSLAMGREGYAWACLCPTAREGTVRTPVLGPVIVSPGEFVLEKPSNVKAYASSFLRVGGGQIRNVQIKRVSLVREDGDVAVVEVHAAFQSWPQWANIVAVVAFVINRVLGAILFLVLFLSLRKRHEATFRKTLLRASNGLWYVYTGDLFEADAGD
jgi:hypothetical protein